MTDRGESEWRRTIEIAGHSADAFVPERPIENRAVLFLHGHAGVTLKGNEAFTAELRRQGLRCLCPHGGPCWWVPHSAPGFGRDSTPFDFLTGPVTDWIERHWQVTPPGIAVTGVSMGAQGALQLAYRHARDFPVVAAVSPIIDFHRLWGRGLPMDDIFKSAEDARQASPILHLHPMNWPRYQLLLCDPNDKDWFEGVERLVGKLASSGVPHEKDLTTKAGGHSWDYFNTVAPRVIEFLADSLQADELRIV